jgi:phage terminase Nu1 subunit (DNA packaging protein)
MAAICELSSKTVASLTRRGVMQRGGKGKLKLELSIRAYCEHLRQQASGRIAGETKSSRPRRRKIIAVSPVSLTLR